MFRKSYLAFLPICFFLLAGCASQKVQQGDKALIISAADLADYGYGFKQISKYETFNKKRYLDGSLDLEYEFETPEKEENEPLYITVTLSAQTKNSEAMLTEGIEKASSGLTLKWGNLKQQPIKGAKKYGNSSTLNLLLYEGLPVGNYFICRQGKRTYSIIIAGSFCIDDPAVWDELVGAKVRKWLNTP